MCKVGGEAGETEPHQVHVMNVCAEGREQEAQGGKERKHDPASAH
jgi:hypothetical protein